MRIVLRIGGSIIASPLNPSLITKYVETLNALAKEKHELLVVVGGGTLARDLIAVAKQVGLSEPSQDRIAIMVSRLIAQIFLEKLDRTGCKKVPLTLKEAAACLRKRKIVVMGGLKPGMTTDTVAALAADRTRADLLVKATDQDGVYDKDPRKHAGAVLLRHMRLSDLSTVFSEAKHKAGIHQIIDPEAVKILRQNVTKIIVVNGAKPENVVFVVKGKAVGTLID